MAHIAHGLHTDADEFAKIKETKIVETQGAENLEELKNFFHTGDILIVRCGEDFFNAIITKIDIDTEKELGTISLKELTSNNN